MRRIVRQLMTENLLLSLLGAGGGLLLAFWGVQGLKQIPRVDLIRLDSATLLFTLAVTLMTAALFGLAPALRASRVDLHGGIKEGARASHSSRKSNHAFVIAQISLSLVLLIGAALLLQSY